MAVKPKKLAEYKEVTYTASRFTHLKKLRKKSATLMEALEKFHLIGFVHGSVARGDVNADSDIDIFIPELQNSFLVETALEKAKLSVNSRSIVQATPNYAMKAHIEIDESTTISFPLMEMRRVEREFYRFGGEINSAQLKADLRVPGVDKRLMLIEPTAKGHTESTIIGKETLTAKILNVAAETVLDRVHALTKRDTIGRTGLFVKRELLPEETFELALKKLSDKNPAVRRRMKKEV